MILKIGYRIIILPIILIVILSCKQENNKQEVKENNYKEFKEYNIKVNYSQSFKIKEIKRGSTLSDIFVTGIGFQNKSNTINYKNNKPVKDILISDLNADGFEELYIITESGLENPKLEILGIAICEKEKYKKIYIPEFDKKSNFEHKYLNGYLKDNAIFFENQKLLRKITVRNDNLEEEKIIIYKLVKINEQYSLQGKLMTIDDSKIPLN